MPPPDPWKQHQIPPATETAIAASFATRHACRNREMRYHLGFFDRWHITSCTETQSCISDTAMRHTWAVARSRCDTRPLSHELTTTHPACRTCSLRHPYRASSGTGNVVADSRHNLRVARSGLRYSGCIAEHQCDTLGLSHARIATLQPCRTQLLRYTMRVAHTFCDTRIVPLEAV